MDWKDVYPRPQLRRAKWQSLCGQWLLQGEEIAGGEFCAVLQALSAGDIAPSRHESYRRLYELASTQQDWEYKDQ